MAAAKKDEKTKGEREEQPDEEAIAAAKKEKKKKLLKILMFVGLGILVVGLIVGATLFAAKSFLHKESKATDQESAAASSESASSESSAAAEPEKPAIYLALKPNFMVNYDVNGRQRFLQAELTLMYREETVASLIELHMPELRNGLVMLLSNQSFDELQTVDGKEKLREAALNAVKEIIEKETLASEKSKEKKDEKSKSKKAIANVEQILFTSFVMQ